MYKDVRIYNMPDSPLKPDGTPVPSDWHAWGFGYNEGPFDEPIVERASSHTPEENPNSNDDIGPIDR